MIKRLANWITVKTLQRRLPSLQHMKAQPHARQQAVAEKLLAQAPLTAYGREHGLQPGLGLAELRKRLPLVTYEQLYPWVERCLKGERDILWPGPVEWFAKSSGTSNDRSKFLPVTQQSLRDNHFASGRDMLALYVQQVPDTTLFAGKSLSIGGSYANTPHNSGAKAGDVSAVITANLPPYYSYMREPHKSIALMPQWEPKLKAMAETTPDEDVRGMVGIPTWLILLLRSILEQNPRAQGDLTQVWPKLQVYFHGAVSFAPYRQQFEELIPDPNFVYHESYNASEGFFATQDDYGDPGMLLLLDHGVYYEFLPLSELDSEHPQTLNLQDVEVGPSYALVISTSGGLWRYQIGDTVAFTSLNPYRIVITGRTQHYINVFGEEVMVANTDQALAAASRQTQAIVADYTVGPVYLEAGRSGAHEWLIEFEREPDNWQEFTQTLDQQLQRLNSDYAAKREGDYALEFPHVRKAPRGAFYTWMKRKGKLGGQNKAPRLSNSRKYLDDLHALIAEEQAASSS